MRGRLAGPAHRREAAAGRGDCDDLAGRGGRPTGILAVSALRAVLRPDLPGGRLLSADTAPPSFSLQPLNESVSPGETLTVAIVATAPARSIHLKVRLTTVFGDNRADQPQDIAVARLQRAIGGHVLPSRARFYLPFRYVFA